ncbi:MAG: MGMT family protein [Planctomycetes bacterium]|nr:MGMT family protein [Planctomycetota bacterium]
MNPRYAPIYAAVARIPRGRVSSYGRVAELAGLPRRARLVGRALRELPPGAPVPWQRVLNAAGRISLRAESAELQRALLLAEGVAFRGDRVDLAVYGWP